MQSPHDIIRGVELNAPATDFELCDTEGLLRRLSDHRGGIVIVNFWSCECPHSERTDRALVEMASRWNGDVALIVVASNRSEPPAAIRAVAQSRGLPPVLLDPEHVVADLYEVQTTPHAFLIDRAGILRYRGAVDDVTFKQRQPSRFYLQEAVEALLRGQSPAVPETLAYGCAIVREALE